MTILDEIIAHKKNELILKKEKMPLKTLISEYKDVVPNRFISSFKKDDMCFICEVKKASPSKGLIRQDFDPVEIALIYQNNGAGAISVLTDEKYFMGSLDYLNNISKEVNTPLLRKDFIVDEYQIFEACNSGASAILLIASVFEKNELLSLYKKARELYLDVLMEVHDENDLEKALFVDARIIGINNRDLKTFKTDLSTTEKLIKEIPKEKWVVSESGINFKEDVKRVFDYGARGVLIGEALCREPDIGKKLNELKKYR